MPRVRETFVSVDSGSRDRVAYPDANRFRVYFDRPPLDAVISCELISMIMSVMGLENVSKSDNDFRWAETIDGRSFEHSVHIPSGNYSESDLAVAVQNALNTRTAMQREPHSPRAYGCSFSYVDRRFYISLLFGKASGISILPSSIGRRMRLEEGPPSTYVESWGSVTLSPADFLYLSIPNMNTGVAYVRSDGSEDELPFVARIPTPTSNGMYFCNVCQPGFESLAKRFAPPIGHLGGMELSLTDRSGDLARMPRAFEYSCLFRFRVLEREQDET